MINSRALADVIEATLGTIMRDAGLRLLEVEDDEYGAYARLSNQLVELRIQCEAPFERVFVSLHRLDRGPIKPTRDMAERLRDPLNGFDIEDLIELRLEEPHAAGSARRGGAHVEQTLREYSSLLPLVAGDVLRGQFDVFADLTRVVARRVQASIEVGESIGPDGRAIVQAAVREGLV